MSSTTRPPDGSAALEYRFGFEAGLLREIVFPAQFVDLYPAEALTELLRSLGGAKLDRKRESMSGRADPSRFLEPLPGRARVLAVLGEPSEEAEGETPGGEEILYRYRLRTVTTGEREVKRRAYGRFVFDPEGRMAKVEAGIGSHEIEFDIPSPGEDPRDRDPRRGRRH